MAIQNGAPLQPQTVFVIGLGMVGIAFIEKMLGLDADRRYNIVTVGEEAHLAYNRVQLTDYMEHRSVDKLLLNTPEWYQQNDPERFQFHTSQQVTDIDLVSKVVKTNKGKVFAYDILVIATGSDALYPPYMDAQRAASIDGVFVYRNVADLDSLIAYADRPDINKASVVGGGLIGLEAAKAVYDMPTVPEMTLINRSGWPLSRQLDQDAGEMVQKKIEAMGVEVVTKVDIKDLVLRDEKSPEGRDVFAGFELTNGNVIEADMTVFATGISPRDELARKCGLEVHSRGGIVVNNSLMTSAEDVYAIGECASWKGQFYGLIGPGVEMADILAFNLTQTETNSGKFRPREMNDPDLSTKLKLMGVDVASFGDFFADSRATAAEAKKRAAQVHLAGPATSAPIPLNGISEVNKPQQAIKLSQGINGTNGADAAGHAQQRILETETIRPVTPTRRLHPRAPPRPEEPIKCLTYKDPFSSVYKKYIFTADGKRLLGGMMIGDTSDFVKLVSIVKKKKPIDAEPHQFIIGSKSGEDDGADLDDDTVVCSCHAVTKGMIGKCVKDGITALGDVKTKTKAGTGCGGCLPLITNIFKGEMKKAGLAVSTDLCPHFKMSRMDLYSIIKVKRLKNFKEVMTSAGVKDTALGCEVCKPAVGSILASLYNAHVMEPSHHANQDTNDRFMANMQRNGTFSVVPRVTGGEIQPDHLIVLGQVAKEYNLYSKITGGQRIDLFGAQKRDLPAIWKKLNDAGMESGLAYGKSLRTVKSCVGSTWCRYGIGDSVGLAIQLENRYKVLRSPHKIKGGVSGCVRECAEAQSKDFGLIATDKGWNIFLAGNGGANPKHAILFAQDVPPSLVTKILDRFLMLYVRMADKLMRTARWIEQFDGGIEKLRKIIIDDELGICADLDKEMEDLVSTYVDEWSVVTADPERQKHFRQFVNTEERIDPSELITERGQQRPADWPKDYPPVKFRPGDIATPRSEWQWIKLARMSDLAPTEAGTTSCAVRYSDSQLAIFHIPGQGLYATQQMCPHKRFFGLEHGLVGDDPNTGRNYVSCPLHKRNFTLDTGDCLNDEELAILTFEAKQEASDVYLKLPPADELDAMIGTTKWMLRAATADAYERNAATQIELAGPEHGRKGPSAGTCSVPTSEEGKTPLSW